MRAVIFGGTFNPVHIGHLFLCEEVLHETGYDTVILVPSNQPVHKPAGGIMEPGLRLEMLRRAVAGNDALLVDDCEIRRGGRSYTIDTVAWVMETYPISGKPGLLVGDDLVAEFHLWKNAELLSRSVELIVARRDSSVPVPCPYPHRYVDNPIVPLSSTQIRQRIADGKAFRYLVPPSVFDYIGEHGLYREPARRD